MARHPELRLDGAKYVLYPVLLWNTDGKPQCPRCANVDEQHTDMLQVQYDIEPKYDKATYFVTCSKCPYCYAFDLYRGKETRE